MILEIPQEIFILVEQGVWPKDSKEAMRQINPEMCLMIGDFGIGSDAAIILDYADSLTKPVVKRQVYHPNGNYWELIATSFEDFIAKIGLSLKK